MSDLPTIRVGMVGVGMIFEETYLPVLRRFEREPLYRAATGPVRVKVGALVSRTGRRAARWLGHFATPPNNYFGDRAVEKMLTEVDAVCVATPDDRHFE